MTVRPGTVLTRVCFKAATRPVCLGATGAAALGAILLQSGSLAVAGVTAFFVTTAAALVRGGFWRTTIEGLRREAPSLPFEEDFTDPSTRALLIRLASARHERRSVCDRLVAPAMRGGSQEWVADLEETAIELLRALDRLASHLAPDGRSALRDRLDRLRSVAEAAPPEARAEYDRAKRALEGKLGALEELQMRRQLLVSRLEVVLCTLEALPEHLARPELCEVADRLLRNDLALRRVSEEIPLAEPAADDDGISIQPQPGTVRSVAGRAAAEVAPGGPKLLPGQRKQKADEPNQVFARYGHMNTR